MIHKINREVINNPNSIEIWRLAIKNYSKVLSFAPKFVTQDYEACMLAIKCDFTDLAYIDESILDINICIEAVLQNERALRYVPYKIKNEVFMNLVNEVRNSKDK